MKIRTSTRENPEHGHQTQQLVHRHSSLRMQLDAIERVYTRWGLNMKIGSSFEL